MLSCRYLSNIYNGSFIIEVFAVKSLVCLMYQTSILPLNVDVDLGAQDGEVFTKTTCYHYFHSHCLGRYVTHSEQELQERVRELEQDKTRDRGEDKVQAQVPFCPALVVTMVTHS